MQVFGHKSKLNETAILEEDNKPTGDLEETILVGHAEQGPDRPLVVRPFPFPAAPLNQNGCLPSKPVPADLPNIAS